MLIAITRCSIRTGPRESSPGFWAASRSEKSRSPTPTPVLPPTPMSQLTKPIARSRSLRSRADEFDVRNNDVGNNDLCNNDVGNNRENHLCPVKDSEIYACSRWRVAVRKKWVCGYRTMVEKPPWWFR